MYLLCFLYLLVVGFFGIILNTFVVLLYIYKKNVSKNFNNFLINFIKIPASIWIQFAVDQSDCCGVACCISGTAFWWSGSLHTRMEDGQHGLSSGGLYSHISRSVFKYWFLIHTLIWPLGMESMMSLTCISFYRWIVVTQKVKHVILKASTKLCLFSPWLVNLWWWSDWQ